MWTSGHLAVRGGDDVAALGRALRGGGAARAARDAETAADDGGDDRDEDDAAKDAHDNDDDLHEAPRELGRVDVDRRRVVHKVLLVLRRRQCQHRRRCHHQQQHCKRFAHCAKEK